LVRKDGDAGDVFVVDTVNSNVGIGITPDRLLHVSTPTETAIATFQTLRAGAVGGNIQYKHLSGTPADADTLVNSIFTGYNDAGTPEEIGFATVNTYSDDVTDGSEDGGYEIKTMVAGTDTTVIRIKDGNIGIGTSSPTQKLSVDTGHIQLTDGYGLIWGSGGSKIVGTDAGDYLSFYVNGENMRIDSSGNIGIGTPAPETKFTIDQSAHSDALRIYGYDTVATRYGELSVLSNGYTQLNSSTDRGLVLKGHGIDLYVNSGADHFIRASYQSQLVLDYSAALGGTALLPTLAFGDGDTGLYETADDNLAVSIAGTKTWDITSSAFGKDAVGYPVMKNLVASSTVPSLLPNAGDTNTGIGWVSADTLSLIAGGVGTININTLGIKLINGTAANPAYTFINDPNTGIYSYGADVLGFSIGGNLRAKLQSNGFSLETGTDRPKMLNEDATGINPNLIPSQGDTDTGLGWNAADELSLIAGATELMRLDNNDSKIYPFAPVELGSIEAEQDSGAITLFNMPVSSTPTSGDEMSASFSIDSDVVLKVYAESDGTGGVQNHSIDLQNHTLGGAASNWSGFGTANIPDSAAGYITVMIDGSTKRIPYYNDA